MRKRLIPNSQAKAPAPRRCPTRERGSALLIVFVFAAIVAIMLYREMPVAAFEARRQKEELLIDRGNEYKHAIKLYVKKIGQFPPSIDALENTNRMRFLRHKFDDPITGKNDWRLLHAGPNGIIIDSKVQTASAAPGTMPGTNQANQNSAAQSTFGGSSSFGNSNNNANGAPAGNTSNSSFGSSNSFGRSSGSSGFGTFANSFSSSNSENANGGPSTLAAVPQRAPAVSASGAPAGNNGDPSANQTPGQADDPNAQAAATASGQLAGTNGDPSSQMRALVGNQNPVASQMSSNQASTQRTGALASASNSSFGSNPSAAAPGTATGAPAGDTFFGQGSTFGQSTMGKVTGGGSNAIAGVASIAVGKTIKTVNDQTQFSLWEFYYDMAKDASSAMAGAMGAGNTGTTATNGQSGTQATMPTGSSSSFGGSSFGGSNSGSFGNNSGSSFGSSSGTTGGSSFGNGSFGNSSSSSFGTSPTTITPTAPATPPSTPPGPGQP